MDHKSLCPINLMLEVIGDRWSLLIIRDLMFGGKRHFRELLQSEEKIATNILTDRLGMLEREGIITKTPDPSHKQKHIYRLTTKGVDLLPIIVEFTVWSIKYSPADLEKHKHARMLSKAGKEKQQELKKILLKEHGVI